MNLTFKEIGLFGLLLCILLSLGFWQLRRAEQKQEYLDKQLSMTNASESSLAKFLHDSEASPERFMKVRVKGEYDDAHQFLLDNQTLEGKPGYLVLSPFFMENADKAVLVNRGWVALNPDRTILPDLSVKQLRQELRARVNHFPSVGLVLAGAEIPSPGWPSVVGVVNPKELEKRLGYPLYDFQLELNPDQIDGYQRKWQQTKLISPEKHRAYALQWFGLALTLCILDMSL